MRDISTVSILCVKCRFNPSTKLLESPDHSGVGTLRITPSHRSGNRGPGDQEALGSVVSEFVLAV